MLSQPELTGKENGAEDGWERGNLTTEGALPYRRISNAAKRFSPNAFIYSTIIHLTRAVSLRR